MTNKIANIWLIVMRLLHIELSHNCIFSDIAGVST